MRAGVGGLLQEYVSALATTRRALGVPALRKPLERVDFLSLVTDEPLSRAEAERTAADRLLDTTARLRET